MFVPAKETLAQMVINYTIECIGLVPQIYRDISSDKGNLTDYRDVKSECPET